MGFSLKKFVKRATKIPKSIKKLKVGKTIVSAAKGFVIGGPIGAVAGAAKNVVGQAQDYKALQDQAKLDLQAQAQVATEPVPINLSVDKVSTAGVAVSAGTQDNTKMMLIVGGAVVVVGILIFAMRKG